MPAGSRGFAPSSLSKVKGWINWADGTGLGTTGYEIPDRIQEGTSAVQETVADQPSISTINGFQCATLDGVSDYLRWQLTAAMNSATSFGFAFWYRPTTVTGAQNLAAHFGDGNVNRHFWRVENGSTSRVYGPSSTQNVSMTSAGHTAGVFQFIRMSYVGGLAAANRVEMAIDGVLQTVGSSSAGGLDEIPATLNTEGSTAGRFLGIGGLSGGGQTLNGVIGPNVYIIADDDEHLTSAEEENLMNFQSMEGV